MLTWCPSSQQPRWHHTPIFVYIFYMSGVLSHLMYASCFLWLFNEQRQLLWRMVLFFNLCVNKSVSSGPCWDKKVIFCCNNLFSAKITGDAVLGISYCKPTPCTRFPTRMISFLTPTIWVQTKTHLFLSFVSTSSWRIKLSGVIETVETISVVSLKQRRQSQQCH